MVQRLCLQAAFAIAVGIEIALVREGAQSHQVGRFLMGMFGLGALVLGLMVIAHVWDDVRQSHAARVRTAVELSTLLVGICGGIWLTFTHQHEFRPVEHYTLALSVFAVSLFAAAYLGKYAYRRGMRRDMLKRLTEA